MTLRSAVLVLIAAGLPALGQAPATASLRGRVLDPQGTAVPGAVVVLRQAATGVERELVAESGSFSAVDLLPGSYQLRVRASGFAERSYPALQLRVGQQAEVTLRLEAASLAENVEVTGKLNVQELGSSVSGVLATQDIERLPLNGRNYLELAFLVPGNAPAPNFDPTKTNSVVVSSAGQLGRGGNVMIDGADNNDDAVGGPLVNLPQDAVQEFQIATNRFSAEIGRSAGSAINVVTRSGSETWNGTAAVYFRDDSLQGTPATLDPGQEEPPFSREQYALSGGGPLLPGKLFAFGAIEYRDQKGAVLVGRRDTEARRIVRSFADAPLDDFLGMGRLDWVASGSDRVSLRYAMQRADDTGASTLDRAIGSASQRQESRNRYHDVLGTWTKTIGSSAANSLSVSWNRFRNEIDPVAPGRQLTYPSLQDGASFRVPQGTDHDRIQVSDSFSWTTGGHSLRFGGQVQRIDSAFHLGVFREGRIEFVQDFPQFDANGDGRVDDNDLLFAVTLRSGFPDRDLELLDCDNTHFAFFVQDDWRVHPQLSLSVGLRYEIDTDVKNISGYDQLNPLAEPFLKGDRKRDANNFAPRIGFNWESRGGRLAVRGGYGVYYDRVTLEIMSLERGLDGRALPVEVRAGNVFFLGPNGLPPFAPSLDDPFTGFQLPGAGASGINIIDNALENPTVQQLHLGFEARLSNDLTLNVDGIHNHGTHFIIGRSVGTVFNPVVGGPDNVLNLESSVGTKYDGLLVSARKRFGSRHWLRASYTLSKAFNYANDDQIPFSSGPIDPNDLEREYGPTPNDQRHRFSLAGSFDLPWRLRIAPLLTLASAVPMDILMPSGTSRVPTLQRNAGGRQFKSAAELNAYLEGLNASGGIQGVRLPLVSDDARFGDSFQSLDLRLSRDIGLGGARRLEAIVEIFNLWNATNILGVSKSNYSGYSNVLVRDSDDPSAPGYLRSSKFGQPVTTAGGVFGSGGPRAFQLGARLHF